jgi:hypothetical protein
VAAQKTFTYFDIAVRDLVALGENGFFVLVRFLQVLAFERTGEGDFTLGAAANGTDIALDGGAGAARTTFSADLTQDRLGHSLLAIIGAEQMKRVDLHIKVSVDLDEEEDAQRVASEICRQIEKMHVVRSAELSSVVEGEI